MFKFKKPVTVFFFSFFLHRFRQGDVFLNVNFLSSCGMYRSPCQVYWRYSGQLLLEKELLEHFILPYWKRRPRKFSLHLLGSLKKFESMYDFSAVLPEQLVELLVTTTEHQGPHSSYIPHTNDIILGCIYVYATEKRERTKSSVISCPSAYPKLKTSFLILNFGYKFLELKTCPFSFTHFSEKRNLMQVGDMKWLVIHKSLLTAYQHWFTTIPLEAKRKRKVIVIQRNFCLFKSV